MNHHLPRRPTGRRLRLWHIWIVLPAAFVAALAVAAGAFLVGWDLLGAQGLRPERQLTSRTLFDLVKLSFGVVAGAGALVALVVAYRRQRVDEDGALRDATRLHTERFTTAVSQLGKDSAAVRLGGVHALAGLADDAPTTALRQTCIDVLCAYLRLPYTARADLPAGDAAALHAYLALREVRHTVIRLIRDHLRLPADHPHSWQGHDLDFTGVVFDGGDFSKATFSGARVNFRDTTFTDSRVDFHGATFTDSTVSFSNATFSGGQVNFVDAKFSGGRVFFTRAQFSGSAVSFSLAKFSGGEVYFSLAKFSGGQVSFEDATFSGAVVTFDRAEFFDHRVTFDQAEFSGGALLFFHARGTAPSGLEPRPGQILSARLDLPAAWHSNAP
ncbi:hypothetical protein CCS38_20240 [Streptomyces purpurogeneiscleroticus]|nr:hypothetical protein [Streptomyces purpurogeneiscleroticus]